MDEDRRRRAREVMTGLGVDEAWLAAADPDSPDWMRQWLRATIDAYRTGDLEWVLGRSHPEIEIVQPRELPDARTYRGHEGVIEALLDWPREWEDFSVEVRRVFAVGDDHAVVDSMHRGRSLRMGIEIEARIVWVFSLDDAGLVRRWDMYASVDQALEAIHSG